MEVKAYTKKREVVITMSAEELAKVTGHDTVEVMMKKYTQTGMKGACVDAFSPKGIKVDYKKVA